MACPVEADRDEEAHLLENRRRWKRPAEHGMLPDTLKRRGLPQMPLTRVLQQPGGQDRLDGHPKRKQQVAAAVPSLTRLLRGPGGPDQLDGHPKRLKKKRAEEAQEQE